MHAVILDDLPERHLAFSDLYRDKYDIANCYNIAQFVHHLVTYPGRIDFISFDHDLGDDTVTGTGMDAVKLAAALLDPTLTVRLNVHSYNTVRALEMVAVLEDCGFKCSVERL